MREGDRIAVALLRGSDAHGTEAIQANFKDFRDRLRDIGLQILEVDAVILGEDESHILGWLAALQRQRVEPAIESWRMATAEAQLCAGHLNRLGCRIDYHRVIQTQATDFSSRLTDAGWENVLGPPSMSEGKKAILRALDEMGPMKTVELTALGVSRQTLSMMVKQKLIRRLRYGVYARTPRMGDQES